MNDTFTFLFALAFTFGCSIKPGNEAQQIIPVEKILSVAEEKVDREVILSGRVSHVCSHSGRRCFLIDESGEFSIRVEAGGNIENFGKELTGNFINVRGIIKEQRISTETIDQWETDILEKHPEEAEKNGEHCSAEMANINQMKSWMKEHGKDYYAIFYMEGQSYESLP